MEKIFADATDRVLAVQEKSNRRCGRRRVKRMISAVVAFAHFETGASKAG